MAFRVFGPKSLRCNQIAKPVSRKVVAQSGKNVAISYANALVELAQEKDVLESVHTDVAGLEAMLKSDDALKTFICNPVITKEKKDKVIDSVAKEANFQPMTANFLKLLVDRQRIDNITEILQQFEEKYCQLTDTQVAYLRSAVKLEQEQQFLVAKKLQEITGSKNIKLKPVIDESLIAGFIVEYGSSQIDLSIRGALDRINAELMAAVEKV